MAQSEVLRKITVRFNWSKSLLKFIGILSISSIYEHFDQIFIFVMQSDIKNHYRWEYILFLLLLSLLLFSCFRQQFDNHCHNRQHRSDTGEDEQKHNKNFPSVQAFRQRRLPPLVVVGENLVEETEMPFLLPLVKENKILLPLVTENKVLVFRLLVLLVNEDEIRIFLLALVLNLSSNTLCARNCSYVLRAFIPDQSLQKSLLSILSPCLSNTICLKNFNRH